MKHFIRISALLCALLNLAAPVRADSDGALISICRPEVIAQQCQDRYFGSTDFAFQAPLHRCMNEMMVCRRYGELSNKLLATIGRTQGALPPIQQYFLGAALYHLHMQSRSEGLRCELGRMSRDQLQDFLVSAKLKFTDTGSFGNIGLRYIRDAINSLQVLARPNQCPESSLSYTALVAIAKQAAIEETENLFRNIDIPDPADAASRPDNVVTEKMIAIFTDLRSATSMASELEIGSKMVETELEANQQKLNAIVESLDSRFYREVPDGKVKYDPASGAITLPSTSYWVGAATTKIDQLNQASIQMENAKKAALKVMKDEMEAGSSPEESYNNLRVKYSSLAMNWAAEAAFQDEVAKTLLPENLYAPIGGGLTAGNPLAVFTSAKQAFKNKSAGACISISGRNRWYCK